jgi:hypothetical protein
MFLLLRAQVPPFFLSGLVDFVLVFYVTPDIFLRYGADGLAVIRMVPKLSFPQPLLDPRELHKQPTSRDPFEVFHDLRDGEFWRSREKTVDMVSLSAFEKMDGKTFLVSNLLDNVLKI